MCEWELRGGPTTLVHTMQIKWQKKKSIEKKETET